MGRCAGLNIGRGRERKTGPERRMSAFYFYSFYS